MSLDQGHTVDRAALDPGDKVHSLRISVSPDRTKIRAYCDHDGIIDVDGSKPMAADGRKKEWLLALVVSQANSNCSRRFSARVYHDVEGVAYY